jgi:O-antigen ligase
MEWVLIAFILLYVISLIWNILEADRFFRFSTAFLLTILAIIIFGLFLAYENRNTPTALDVYQDKTTLEITYRDSIPVDSVVVFKK